MPSTGRELTLLDCLCFPSHRHLTATRRPVAPGCTARACPSDHRRAVHRAAPAKTPTATWTRSPPGLSTVFSGGSGGRRRSRASLLGRQAAQAGDDVHGAPGNPAPAVQTVDPPPSSAASVPVPPVCTGRDPASPLPYLATRWCCLDGGAWIVFSAGRVGLAPVRQEPPSAGSAGHAHRRGPRGHHPRFSSLPPPVALAVGAAARLPRASGSGRYPGPDAAGQSRGPSVLSPTARARSPWYAIRPGTRARLHRARRRLTVPPCPGGPRPGMARPAGGGGRGLGRRGRRPGLRPP